MDDSRTSPNVVDDLSRLRVLERDGRVVDPKLVVEALRQDVVVLVRALSPQEADTLIHAVATGLNLADSLELQAEFAGFRGHRHNMGKYFMSVNKRTDYQFVSPHSEGSRFLGMQLASFYCHENSTDGGESILMNVDDSSDIWPSLREKVSRGRLGPRGLARHEVVRARGLYQIRLPDDVVKEDDRILQEHPSEIPGLTIVEVLAKTQRSYSCILDRELNVYWDSIESIDFDSAREYASLLRSCGLLKEPRGGLGLEEMDADVARRKWHSGVNYYQLFKCKIILKLTPGDLIVQNNLTWTHAAANWSPGSGTRKIAASFA